MLSLLSISESPEPRGEGGMVYPRNLRTTVHQHGWSMGWDGVGWGGVGLLWGEARDPKKQSSELRDFDAPPQRLDCVGGPFNAVGSHRRGLAGKQWGQICLLESKGLGGGRLVPGVQVKRVELPDWADWVKRCLERQWGSWQLTVCGWRDRAAVRLDCLVLRVGDGWWGQGCCLV